MKSINHCSPEDFLSFIIGQVDRVTEKSNNYSHTHDRVSYNPETGHLYFEEVCINEYGSCFALGIYGKAYIPVEWNSLLPTMLTQSPYWMDLDTTKF